MGEMMMSTCFSPLAARVAHRVMEIEASRGCGRCPRARRAVLDLHAQRYEVMTRHTIGDMQVEDRPGVLADISRILADASISINAMVQREPAKAKSRSTSSCSPSDARREHQHRDRKIGSCRGNRQGDEDSTEELQ